MRAGFPKQPDAARDVSRGRPRSLQKCGFKTNNIQSASSASVCAGGHVLNRSFDSWQPGAGGGDDFVGSWECAFRTNKSPCISSEGIQSDFCFVRGSNSSIEDIANFAAVADASCFMPTGSCEVDTKDDPATEMISIDAHDNSVACLFSAHREPKSNVSKYSKKLVGLPESAIQAFSNVSTCEDEIAMDEVALSMGFRSDETVSTMPSASSRCKSGDLVREGWPPPVRPKIDQQRRHRLDQEVLNHKNVLDVGVLLRSQDSPVAVDIAKADPLCANDSLMRACPTSWAQPAFAVSATAGSVLAPSVPACTPCCVVVEHDAGKTSNDAHELKGFREAAEEVAADHPVKTVSFVANPHVCDGVNLSLSEDDEVGNTPKQTAAKLAPLWLVRSKRRHALRTKELEKVATDK